MANNTVQTGADTIRTEDRAGVKTQVGLLDIAQSGAAELMGLGDRCIRRATSAGLTTASTAYTAGDQLGTELSFTTIVRASGLACLLESATLVDKADVVGAIDLFLFDASVSPAADNAANAWSDADLAKLLTILHFADLADSANNRALIGISGPAVLQPATGTTIFGSLVTRSGHTFFGAVTDLVVTLGVTRD